MKLRTATLSDLHATRLARSVTYHESGLAIARMGLSTKSPADRDAIAAGLHGEAAKDLLDQCRGALGVIFAVEEELHRRKYAPIRG